MSKTQQPPPDQMPEPAADPSRYEDTPPCIPDLDKRAKAYWTATLTEQFALALLANPRLDQIIGTTRTDPVALVQALHDYCHRAATAWLAAQPEISQ